MEIKLFKHKTDGKNYVIRHNLIQKSMPLTFHKKTYCAFEFTGERVLDKETYSYDTIRQLEQDFDVDRFFDEI